MDPALLKNDIQWLWTTIFNNFTLPPIWSIQAHRKETRVVATTLCPLLVCHSSLSGPPLTHPIWYIQARRNETRVVATTLCGILLPLVTCPILSIQSSHHRHRQGWTIGKNPLRKSRRSNDTWNNYFSLLWQINIPWTGVNRVLKDSILGRRSCPHKCN